MSSSSQTNLVDPRSPLHPSSTSKRAIAPTLPPFSNDPMQITTQQPRAHEATPPPMFPMQQSYAKEIPLPKEAYGWYESMMSCIGGVLGGVGSIPLCVCFPNPYKTVEQGNVGLITRFGRYYKSVDPGLHEINPITETIQRLNVKIQIESIPTQSVMSKDNVLVMIDSVLYWHIIDPYTAAFLVNDVRKALVERTQTTLRQIVGARDIQTVIEQRETVAQEIQLIVEGPASTWGVKVESILIKDMNFSQELQQTLSSAAKQQRLGESKIIAARAEVESAKLMREASDILNTPAAMQIRYLETLNSMAGRADTKVIFMPPNAHDLTPEQTQQRIMTLDPTLYATRPH
ncbi:stomatin family protein [Fimicolochytrium jonesii]|uniref:stomatin family protein n=1 Tax=Fimicolochytrium jonesii TaxID=1396493 RepID=UPI0022FDBD9C|nr:stomatin family protein [Fimicolochytrium jonesii]KAI8817310.1 stomatin family protein [Fimicolochytrium jonesii]